MNCYLSCSEKTVQIFEDSQARSALWEGEDTRLDRAISLLELASSRSRAAELIAAGAVRVDGKVATKPGVRVRAGQEVCVTQSERYVSAGALKLIAALDAFALSPAGKVALDVGASTGGFTQVLLERGATQVFAIDVGHDQLSPVLRGRKDVILAEGVNARDLTPELLREVTGSSAMPQIIVGDLSFISLTLLFAVLRDVAAPGADFVLLVKPQFEQGKPHKGVITDPLLWQGALVRVLQAAEDAELMVCGLMRSPILGGEGNREFLAHFRKPQLTEKIQTVKTGKARGCTAQADSLHSESVNQGEWMQWILQVCEKGQRSE